MKSKSDKHKPRNLASLSSHQLIAGCDLAANMPPTPDQPFVVGLVTTTSFSVAWEVRGQTQINKYIVHYKRYDEGEGSWQRVETDGNHQEFRFEGLRPDTAYHVRVASSFQGKQSLTSMISNVIRTAKEFKALSFSPTPEKPSSCGQETHNSVVLFWNVTGDTSSITHYSVTYRACSKVTDFKPTDKWDTYVTKDAECICVINGLKPKTDYRFYVSSHTSKGMSPPSGISDLISTTSKDWWSTFGFVQKPMVPTMPCKENRTSSYDIQESPSQAPPIPDKPVSAGPATHNSIPLAWQTPGDLTKVLCFSVSYKEVNTDYPWMTVETEKAENMYTIDNLLPDTYYQFCIASHSYKGQQSQRSEICDLKTEKDPNQTVHQKPPKPQKPVVVGTPGATSITLCWQVLGDISNVTHFTISFHKTGDKAGWTTLETEDTTLTYVIEELEPDTCYHFKVSANRKDGQSSPSETSEPIKTTKDLRSEERKPPTPKKPKLVGTPDHSSIRLCWNVPGNMADITNYILSFQSVSTGGLWKTIETSDTERSYTIDGLDSDTDHQFCVASVTERGKSPQSAVSDIIRTTQNPSNVEFDEYDSLGSPPKLADQAVSPVMHAVQNSGAQEFPVPLKPNLFGEPDHDSVPLTWVVNESNESITHFTITYKRVTGTGKGRWMNFETDNNETTCVVDELDPETDYWFRVAANTKLRQGKPSEKSDIIKTSKKKQSRAQLMPPTPDTPDLNDMGQVSHDSVPLAWHVPGDTTHVTHFTVTYRTPGTRNWTTFDTERAVTSCIVDSLKPDTFYQFRVASNTTTGQSPPSQISNTISTFHEAKPSKIDKAPPKPQKPTPITGSLTMNTVCLVWKITDVKSTLITHFTVSYKKVGERRFLNIFETDGGDTHCTVEGLDPGTSYQFQVAANNDMGQSAPSEISNIIKTPENLQIKPFVELKELTPLKPKLLGIPSHTSIQLRWKVRENTHVSVYTVSYRTTNSKSNWITLETDSNKCTISDLSPATSYVFRVASNTNEGQSPHSEISDPITTDKVPTQVENKPPKPQKPKMIGIPGHNSVQLQWEVPGNTAHVMFFTLGYQSINKKDAWMTIETENTTTNYTVKNLDPLTSYQFRVASNTDQGQSPQSVVSDVITTSEEPQSRNDKRPPKPSKPRITGDPGFDKVELLWNVVGDTSYVTHYTVSYRKCDAKRWMTEETDDASGYYIVEYLDPDTSYQFRIASNTNDEQSQPSEISDLIQTSSAQNSSPPTTRSSIKKTQPVPPMVSKIPTPGAPRIAEGHKPTQQTIPLVWEADTNNFSVTKFTLSYRPCNSSESASQQQDIPGSRCEYTVQKLKPGTSYLFKVQAHSQTISSDSSCESGPFTTAVDTADQIYRVNLQKQSQMAPADKGRGMPLYQIPLKTAKKNDAEKIQLLEFGHQPAVPQTVKVILVVGATGSGKSTLINGLFNYVVGVEWSEKCRFRLVEELGSFDSQHKSQTRVITVYTLHHNNVFKIPYTLKIIDTPGFGDTDGIDKDKQITEAIRKLFTNEEYGITHIDAIGFVAQASLARLTPTQKYIFDSILSLFGKDIGDNIFLLLTFSDSQLPPVLASTKAAQIPYHSHFKFNNSALFALNDTEDNEFDQMFWKMGIASFNKFLKELAGLEGKSLLLTQEVLNEREQLEVYVAGIQQEIHHGLTKLEQYKVEAAVVKQHEADIEKNKDFTYTVDEQKMVQVDLEPGQHVTNCITCNYTCHYLCIYANDEDKIKCSAMDSEGNCTVCSQKCIWSMHKNVPFRIVMETETVSKTSDELKNRYEEAKGEKLTAEKLTQNILEDFHNLEIKVLHMTQEIKRCLTRLSEIALRPNPLTTVDYIDILITSERTEAKPGFQARIDQLEVVKKRAEVLGEMADDSYDPFTQYRQEFPSLQPGKSPRTALGPGKQVATAKNQVKDKIKNFFQPK